MRLSNLAEEYVRRNGLRARTIVKNCRRWDRWRPDDLTKVESDHISQFRQHLSSEQLAAHTIEKTITDVLTVLKANGVEVSAGKRLRRAKPEPKPASIDTIEAIWPHSPVWFQRWLVLTYWTGCRCEDSVRLFREVSSNNDAIRLRASKTGHCHSWPVPQWLAPWMAKPVEHPLNGVSLWFTNIIRDGLTMLCEKANVERITPKNLRQRSITEWSRANATAGAIVHGCGLGVLAHYLDPLQILESAAPRVRLPECFGACTQAGTEDTLISNFRRLDPAAQSLIVGTTERLAAS